MMEEMRSTNFMHSKAAETMAMQSPLPELRLIIRLRRLAAFLTVSAAACFVSGLFSVVSASAALVGATRRFGIIFAAGNIAIAVTVVLMFVTAHCSDKIDQTKATIRELRLVKEKQ